MAINESTYSTPVDTRFANGVSGDTVSTRIGLYDGLFQSADSPVVVETVSRDGTRYRLATEREIAAYERIKAEADRTTARASIRTATTVVELRDALIAAGIV